MINLTNFFIVFWRIMQKSNSKSKWLILILAGLTNAIAGAAPSMSMAVLFYEISTDLQLSLVQIGLIWGLSSIPAIVSMLIGGFIVDQFDPKRIAIVATILVGITGALRGVASGFYSLLLTTLLLGFFIPLIIMGSLKTCRLWFKGDQFGLANGVLSMGMAFGFMLSSLLSASVLSPWLGGWRNVFFFYGALAVLFSIPWVFTPQPTQNSDEEKPFEGKKTFIQSMAHLVRLPNLWLLGIAIFGIGGSIQGTLGYLPLYLRSIGWEAFQADSALTLFHAVSLIFVLPLSYLSDKLKYRKRVLIGMSIMIASGIGLLFVFSGNWVWVAVIIAGFVRDGFMAVFLAMIAEAKGVSAIYSSTAIGFVMIFSGLGNIIAPPSGNLLADLSPSTPFALWAGFALVGILAIFFLQEDKKSKAKLT